MDELGVFVLGPINIFDYVRFQWLFSQRLRTKKRPVAHRIPLEMRSRETWTRLFHLMSANVNQKNESDLEGENLTTLDNPRVTSQARKQTVVRSMTLKKLPTLTMAYVQQFTVVGSKLFWNTLTLIITHYQCQGGQTGHISW